MKFEQHFAIINCNELQIQRTSLVENFILDVIFINTVTFVNLFKQLKTLIKS